MQTKTLGISILTCGLAALAVAACTVDAQLGASPVRGDGTGKDDSDVKSSGEGPGSTSAPSGLPCDVDAILKTKCQTCHASETKYGASAPLVTWDDLQKAGPGGSSGKKVYELVSERVHDDARPMPPSPNPRLTDAESSAIDAWIAAGAKSSTERCSTEAPKDDVKPLSCKPDTVIKAAKGFTMKPTDPLDHYVCAGVDINLTKKRHVIGLAPKVDNKKILHHILLFQAPKAESAEPFACDAFGSAAWKLVAGWAPGGNNLELPPEAGYPEEKGTTHWVIQLHYNNALNKNGETDNSGYELCTTEDLRPNDAGVLAFGSTKFTIPPRASHTIRCDYKLPASFSGVKFFNASPHMHTLGAGMSTERIPGGNGTPEMVFEQKTFDFESQANYPITAAVSPGDIMRTRCSWKNPGDANVGFGEGTGDEMCFDFIGYYPNIPDKTLFGLPVFTWVTPSASASCSAE